MGHNHSHGHHDHGGPTPERALAVALALNASFLVLEAGMGWWTGSLALLSDAGHMLSDVGALAIALIAVRLAARPASSTYTFGLTRAPVLGGLINGLSLIAIVVVIGVEAFERLQSPPDIHGTAVLWTGIAGLGVNLGSAWYLARSRDQSVNTRGAMLHLLSDALGSVAAIVSAVMVGWFGLRVADPVASLVIGVLILVGSWPLLRDTVRILLQRAPLGVDGPELRRTVVAHPRVTRVHDLHVWALDDGQPIMSAVLTTADHSLAEANGTADELRATLASLFAIRHATIECRHRDAPISRMDL